MFSSAELRVLAEKNPTVYERTGTATIAGEVFTIVQPGLNVDLTYDSPVFKADGGDLSIDINTEANAYWEISSEEDWIIVALPQGGTGRGSGSAFIIVAPYNNTIRSRSGILNVAGQEVIVTQRGYELSVDPQVAEVSSNAGAGEFGVAAPITAIWEAIVTHPWITILGSNNGQGNGTIRYSLAPNTTGVPRTGKIIVSGEEYVITQAAAPLKIISIVGADTATPMSSLTITFTSNVGSSYAIERSRDLTNWETLRTITGEENSTELTVEEPINGDGVGFYRVRKEQ